MYSLERDFDDEFLDKWKFRIQESLFIKNLILSNCDFFVYGAPGCGKSTLIRDLIKTLHIQHIRINCIQCRSKQQVLGTLSNELIKIFQKTGFKHSVKLRLFINELQQLVLYQNDLRNANMEPQKIFSFMHDRFFIILDNFEKIDINAKFLSSLLNIKKLLNINFNFCFIGVTVPQQLINENYFFSLLPQFHLSTPSILFLKDVLAQYFQTKEKDEKQVTLFNKIGLDLASDIVQNFGTTITNIGTLVAIGWQIFLIMCKISLHTQSYALLLHSRHYTACKKILMDNPFLIEGKQDILIKKINDFMRNEREELYMEKDRANPLLIPKYEAILLIACWISCRNPEKTDKKLFKDYKRKKKRLQKDVDQTIQLKKVKLERLVALTQSLYSVYLNESDEYQCYDQTTDFYSQIASLEERGLITRITTKQNDELNSVKFLCTIEKTTIQVLAQEHGINIFEYLQI